MHEKMQEICEYMEELEYDTEEYGIGAYEYWGAKGYDSTQKTLTLSRWEEFEIDISEYVETLEEADEWIYENLDCEIEIEVDGLSGIFSLSYESFEEDGQIYAKVTVK